METEVIIVGAGPTGLALACQLTRYGVEFVIIDQKDGVTPYSKALAIHARTLEIYEQLGLAQKAIEQGWITGKVQMFESGKQVGEVDLSNVGAGLSPYPYLLIFEQSRNEQMLFDWLRERDRDVFWSSELESFTQDAASVTATVKRNGESIVIKGKYLVGCDGPRSPVRHGLGLAFEGSTLERIFYVADVRLGNDFDHNALHACIAQHGAVAFFPMPGEKRWRIVGAFPEGIDRDEKQIDYEEIEVRIREEVKIELDFTRVDWFSTYKVHTRHVDRFSSGRCFVAGDAAHIHTPAGGQGMNTGIQDGYNLAWKLALVLKDHASSTLLDTYNEERLPNARRLTETTDRMFNLAAGTDWFTSLVRTTIFPPMAKYILSIESVRRSFFTLISQIGISYRDHSLSVHDNDSGFEIKAGDRMPYFLTEGTSIFDRLREPKFHIVEFSDGSERVEPEFDEKFAALLDRTVVPLYPHVAELFERKESFSILVRPDNYIATIGSEEAIKSYLARLLN